MGTNDISAVREGGDLKHSHNLHGDVIEYLKLAAHKYFKEKDLQGAWMAVMKVMTDDMDNPQAHYLAGQICLDWDYTGAAANYFRRACALRPDVPNNWMGFGAALLDMRLFDEAEQCFKKVIKITPDDPLVYANMGAMYLNQGKPSKCIEWTEKSLQLDPSNERIRSNLGFAYLMMKDWKRGFEDYKYSILSKYRLRRVYCQPEEPDWDGTKNQTVVVQCEQGMGDEISFMSVMPELIRDSKQVIIETHPKLENLFRRSMPGAIVYGTRKLNKIDWPHEYQIDATAQLSQLGEFYRHKDEDFPRQPYLVACEEKRAKWRKWLEQFPRPWVGLSWTGGIYLTNRRGRSVSLEEMSPLIRRGATYFSLQYVKDSGDLKVWNDAHDIKIHKPNLDDADYDDTVAFLAELDHVMSVTTTIIHACGAIGKQCWVLVPNQIGSSQWRYGITGDDIIWYPKDCVRLFRQQFSEGNMAGAIARMEREWRRLLSMQQAA